MRYVLFLLLTCFLQTLNAATYYFSASSGNDLRSSTEAKNSSTPWKSLSKLNSFFSSLQPGDQLLLKRGETFYGSIIVNKSGTSSSPIFIGAYGSGDKPVITSLVTLSGWVSKGSGIWESYNSALGATLNNVLLNGSAQELGRYPNSDANNKGYLMYETHSGTTSITDNQLTSSPNWTGAEAVIRGRRWILDRDSIKLHSGTKITYQATSSYAPYDNYGYFIQKSVKTLDKLGEWYYNPSSKKVSIYFGLNSPSAYAAQATAINNLIYCYKFSYVVFDNLNIKGSNSSGVFIKYGSNVSIENCDVQLSGLSGIEAKFHSGLTIENSTVSNSNNNGIDLGYAGDNAIIRNNKITNTCVFAGMGQSGDDNGLAIKSFGNYNIIEYNEITNTGYTAIYFGGSYVTIKNNLVDRFCITKDDGAGIYTYIGSNAACTGRKVTGNIIINGAGAPAGTSNPSVSPAEGIYADNNTSGLEISDNTVASCSNQGIYIHSSFGITIKNNTLFNNSRQLAIIENTDNSKIRNCTITNNILFSKLASQKVSYLSSPYNDITSFGRFDSNYYARPLDDQSAANLAKVELYESNPVFVNFVSDVRFEYNATQDVKTVILDTNYVDIKNDMYSGSLTLQPFTSVVLIKSSAPGLTSQKPVVSITSPVANSSYQSGTAISIKANASDAGGSITKVQFYNGSTLLHTETLAPYSYSWRNVSSGIYTITAKATDNTGNVTTSAAVKVTVKSSSTLGLREINTASATFASNKTILKEDENILTDFRLYPNPAINTIKLDFEEFPGNKKAKLSIQNMAGSILKQFPLILSVKAVNIDIASLPTGTYVMSLRGDNFSINKKFIKIN